jgi:hypothetical protein
MKKYLPFLYWALFVIATQVIAGIIIFNWFTTNEERATFGDMFGAINTLFAGLAFAGVIYAIVLQQRELELQRKELELTREELARSAKAQESSDRSLAEQVRISQRQLEAVYRPYIIIRVFRTSKNNAVWLRISNTGQIPASNLKLDPDKNALAVTLRGEHHSLSEFNAFNRVIPSFPPGSEISFLLFGAFFMGSPSIEEAGIPLEFTITARYSFPGASIEETTTVDLRPYIDSAPIDDEELDFRQISRELKDINKSLGNVTSAIKDGLKNRR